ncbi:unnamed protein product [Prorocentrum cordatum]|uniref:Protein kinase domain-containing protein n=1 Tax=Prorocentrum cordatum TaxID=2364126 RepID=A0ABN9Q992_9DINO|nr:unnamed protein product [Polarella glacialis]
MMAPGRVPVQALSAREAGGAAVLSFVPPPLPLAPATPAGQHGASPLPPPAADSQSLAPGAEVAMGGWRFRCCGVLGRGSFSQVWAGTVLEGPEPLLGARGVGSRASRSGGEAAREGGVALKVIQCRSQQDLQQALFEAALLERFQALASPDGHGTPAMRVPRYLAHRVEPSLRGGWLVRMAMSRVPGECLDSFLRRPPVQGWDPAVAAQCGCALATQLFRQLGPTLERMAPHAWHRDVNSHNVLLSDALDGGCLRACADAEDMAQRASFWLIDFGLAVDSTTWPSVWQHSDVAGDCRYWPPSSFLMSFFGPEEVAVHPHMCKQYQTQLDIAGLGLTALEVLATLALSAPRGSGDAAGAAPAVFGGPWPRLLAVWQKYREEVSRWHMKIFQVFSSGGDVGPLCRALAQERVVEQVTAHIAKLRTLLRACAAGGMRSARGERAEEARARSLFWVIAEAIDESSSLGLREAVEKLGGPEGCPGRPPQPPPLAPRPQGARAQARGSSARQAEPLSPAAPCSPLPPAAAACAAPAALSPCPVAAGPRGAAVPQAPAAAHRRRSASPTGRHPGWATAPMPRGAPCGSVPPASAWHAGGEGSAARWPAWRAPLTARPPRPLARGAGGTSLAALPTPCRSRATSPGPNLSYQPPPAGFNLSYQPPPAREAHTAAPHPGSPCSPGALLLRTAPAAPGAPLGAAFAQPRRGRSPSPQPPVLHGWSSVPLPGGASPRAPRWAASPASPRAAEEPSAQRFAWRSPAAERRDQPGAAWSPRSPGSGLAAMPPPYGEQRGANLSYQPPLFEWPKGAVAAAAVHTARPPQPAPRAAARLGGG